MVQSIAPLTAAISNDYSLVCKDDGLRNINISTTLPHTRVGNVNLVAKGDICNVNIYSAQVGHINIVSTHGNISNVNIFSLNVSEININIVANGTVSNVNVAHSRPKNNTQPMVAEGTVSSVNTLHSRPWNSARPMVAGGALSRVSVLRSRPAVPKKSAQPDVQRAAMKNSGICVGDVDSDMESDSEFEEGEFRIPQASRSRVVALKAKEERILDGLVQRLSKGSTT